MFFLQGIHKIWRLILLMLADSGLAVSLRWTGEPDSVIRKRERENVMIARMEAAAKQKVSIICRLRP